MTTNHLKIASSIIAVLVLLNGCGGSKPDTGGTSNLAITSGIPPSPSDENGKPRTSTADTLSDQQFLCFNQVTGFDRNLPNSVEDAVKFFALASGKCSGNELQLRAYAKKLAKIFPNSDWSK